IGTTKLPFRGKPPNDLIGQTPWQATVAGLQRIEPAENAALGMLGQGAKAFLRRAVGRPGKGSGHEFLDKSCQDRTHFLTRGLIDQLDHLAERPPLAHQAAARQRLVLALKLYGQPRHLLVDVHASTPRSSSPSRRSSPAVRSSPRPCDACPYT